MKRLSGARDGFGCRTDAKGEIAQAIAQRLRRGRSDAARGHRAPQECEPVWGPERRRG